MHVIETLRRGAPLAIAGSQRALAALPAGLGALTPAAAEAGRLRSARGPGAPEKCFDHPHIVTRHAWRDTGTA